MGPKVIVTGAGASSSYLESPTGVRPPLAREVIRSYHKLGISSNKHVIVGAIVNYVRDTRGIDPFEFGKWDEDIEVLLTEIDEKIQRLFIERAVSPESQRDSYQLLQALSAYSQLIFLFGSIFNEIQCGPISIPYMFLASELSNDDTIVTFNWDTLLDRALMATGNWSPTDGYAINPVSIFDDGWKDPSEFNFFVSKLHYIKLHGSTNWLCPYHIQDLSSGREITLSHSGMNDLFVFWRASKAYSTYENRYWGPYQPYSYCYYPPNLPLLRDDVKSGYYPIRGVTPPELPLRSRIVGGEKDVFSMPLIIPPVRNKQYGKFGQVFSELWNKAEHEISKCKELYIIGYSFPETDVLSREMFTKAIRSNRTLEKVIIINPAPSKIESLCLKEFGIKKSILEIRPKKFEVSHSAKSIL